jgi:gliding-associated putative ABC transporter substrate-binding component GldG
MDQLQTVQQMAQRQYRLRAVSVADGQQVPGDIQVLVIASPRRDLSQWERYAVDQYMMRGGKVAFLIDKVDANLQYQQAAPMRLSIDDWTAAYGFKVNDNLLGDLQNPGALTISQQEGFFRFMSQVAFPFIPSLRDFDKTNVMVKDLERVSFYFASSIDTSAAHDQRLKVEPLIRTSPKTMVQERTYNINPMQQWTKEQFDQGQQIVAAVISGTFTSAFKGKPVPAANDSTAAPAAASPPTVESSPESRLVVIGDGEFFSDQKGGGDPVNVLFFQNLLDWLAQDEALISIRSREVTDRPLKTVSEPTKRIVKYANILGSPLLVALLGIAVWQMRKRRRVEI